jgi:hypothetical protein
LYTRFRGYTEALDEGTPRLLLRTLVLLGNRIVVISWRQVQSKKFSDWYQATSATSFAVQIQEVAGRQDSPIE